MERAAGRCPVKAKALRTPDPERLAGQLVDAVRSSGSSETIVIPLTVAALAMSLLGAPEELLQPTWGALSRPGTGWEQMGRFWKVTLSCHDWLQNHLHPLTGWMHRASEADKAAAAACWEVIAGIDVYLTVKQPGVDGDLLGVLYTQLRSTKDRQRTGSFYTPMSVSKMIAKMTGIAEGTSINDPCCGTGGMLIAAAMVMREEGKDPRSCLWVANDVDALAVALCGVNMAAYGMGPNIVLTAENALLPPQGLREVLSLTEGVEAPRAKPLTTPAKRAARKKATRKSAARKAS